MKKSVCFVIQCLLVYVASGKCNQIVIKLEKAIIIIIEKESVYWVNFIVFCCCCCSICQLEIGYGTLIKLVLNVLKVLMGEVFAWTHEGGGHPHTP